MNKLYTLIYSVLIFTCLSCQQQTPQTQIEQTAIDFCEAFYNFNYTVAKEWSTPSSQSYLSFLASNVGQTHLEQLKTRGAAKVSVISSEIDANLEEASVVCQIKNAFVIHPIGGKMEYIIRKSKFPQNPKRSVRFSGKRTKRSVQKRKARNTQKAETKVL